MIQYKNLSGWLKFAAVVSWIQAVIFAGAFLVGFFSAF